MTRHADELREYAERSRLLAASATDQGMARVLNELADEYFEKAERLDQVKPKKEDRKE